MGITINKTNLSIHIGEVSGDGFICSANHVWRVNPDGALRDTFGKLRRVFMMPEIEFFKHYAKEAASHHEYLDSLNQEIESVKAQIPELPLVIFGWHSTWLIKFLQVVKSIWYLS